MKFGIKLFLTYFALLGLGVYFFLNSMLVEIKPGLRQSLETALVDTANLLAEMIAPQSPNEQIKIDLLKPAIIKTLQRPINATIWSHKQVHTELRIYVTDRKGTVIFDSAGRDLGTDYSQWNDVYLTLQGKYGARSTQEDPNDNFSSVMYIGAPIYQLTEAGMPVIAGVISVGKPNVSVEPFWQIARDNIRSKGMWLLIAAALAGALLATWLSLNIHRLVEYARQVSEGESTSSPSISDPDLAKLALAMEEMRKALDGKKYIEDYTLTLTHEMKSPLTALQGAAELISVAQDDAVRHQLALNINQQTERLRALVDQVLALARLENMQGLENSEQLDLSQLVLDEIEQLNIQLQAKQIAILNELPQSHQITGDKLLLGQAIRNLLENATDFSPQGGSITLTLDQQRDMTQLCIADQGSGIPEYAQDKIWQRFYSLPRPYSGQKSTGLGLSFVQQIALLHQADVSLKNRDEGGVKACLTFHTQNTH
ncbi:two-component system sensor histidine kinase CreC [Neptuniibacter sp.]|uniref:two-component system sensor histidine kinase CreC n=1 Tax=Neptuniibacter sp. TaxID=1962643 RepID=UPI00262568A2|nr:two-component system sensor histidine kinase CreC [Neptuniibacter sp.]MCP4596717.1 two-component system sensor histidine kinase CreC [Neptuniibacter sp.]